MMLHFNFSSLNPLNNSVITVKCKSDKKLKLIGEIRCEEISKYKSFIIYQNFVKINLYPKINITFPFYIPQNSKPSFEGNLAKIEWKILFYDFFKKEKIYEQKLNVLSQEIFNFTSIEDKVKNIKFKIEKNHLIREKINKVKVFFSQKVNLIESYIIVKEILKENNEENEIIKKNINFSRNENEYLFEINAKDFPLTYEGKISKVKCFLNLKLNINGEIFKKLIELNVYSLKAEDRFNFENPIEKLIIKYLRKYGPLSLGDLFVKIVREEKIKLKSFQLKEICEKMINNGILFRTELGKLAGYYFLKF